MLIGRSKPIKIYIFDTRPLGRTVRSKKKCFEENWTRSAFNYFIILWSSF